MPGADATVQLDLDDTLANSRSDIVASLRAGDARRFTFVTMDAGSYAGAIWPDNPAGLLPRGRCLKPEWSDRAA